MAEFVDLNSKKDLHDNDNPHCYAAFLSLLGRVGLVSLVATMILSQPFQCGTSHSNAIDNRNQFESIR